MDVDPVSSPEARETAWQIHAAVADWTGKVDAKAAFALTLESALLAGVAAVASADHRLARMGGGVGALLWTGIALVVVGTALAVLVVTPRVRPKDVVGEASQNFIFFGHLQYWRAIDLERALENTDPLPVLSRQLVVTSKIAWEKHSYVKWSFRSAATGGLLVFLAFMLS
ncbi:Pycsar system effector family protein [Streptacidiphilus sp. N1-3]|uniref:Pycsar system effector family protein n=1 Tax=Streptacidiphilus alkalitolerans TaxID=3342712 RepID=A0ABV6X3U5_9ACTN